MRPSMVVREREADAGNRRSLHPRRQDAESVKNTMPSLQRERLMERRHFHLRTSQARGKVLHGVGLAMNQERARRSRNSSRVSAL